MPLKIGLPLFRNHCLCFNVLYLCIVLEREINDKKHGLIRINPAVHFHHPNDAHSGDANIKKQKKKKLRPAEELI